MALIALGPFLVAMLLSGYTLGWLWLRPHDLPVLVLGQPSPPLVLAGFSVYFLSIIAQSIFWATVQLPRTCDIESFQHCNFATTNSFGPVGAAPAIPPPASFPAKSSLSLTLRKSMPHTSVSSMARASEDTAVEWPDVNHFDEWETDDVGARARVLAVIEQEALEEAEEDVKSGLTTEYELHITTPERQNSPLLPLSPLERSSPVPAQAVLVTTVSVRYTVRSATGTGTWAR